MKKILLSTALLLTILILSSLNRLQAQRPEGTIRYLQTQNWAKMMASVDYISKQQRDRMMYMWGNRSEWKTYMLLHFSPDASKYEDSEEQAEPGAEGWSNRKEVFFMSRDLKENTMFDGITLLGKTYLVRDSIARPNWKILNDMKDVAGHICMNATFTDTLRKQTILAWFALDMPVSTGPDRYCGLPGLILEIDINDGAFVLTADKIDLKPLTTELAIPEKLKGKKIKLAEYNELIANQIKERKANEEPWFWMIRY
jgi:GLPGLI family protein